MPDRQPYFLASYFNPHSVPGQCGRSRSVRKQDTHRSGCQYPTADAECFAFQRRVTLHFNVCVLDETMFVRPVIKYLHNCPGALTNASISTCTMYWDRSRPASSSVSWNESPYVRRGNDSMSRCRRRRTMTFACSSNSSRFAVFTIRSF